jgi:uncharacterized membrane protein
MPFLVQRAPYRPQFRRMEDLFARANQERAIARTRVGSLVFVGADEPAKTSSSSTSPTTGEYAGYVAAPALGSAIVIGLLGGGVLGALLVAAIAGGGGYYVLRSKYPAVTPDLCVEALPEPDRAQARDAIAKKDTARLEALATKNDAKGWHCAAKELRLAAGAGTDFDHARDGAFEWGRLRGKADKAANKGYDAEIAAHSDIERNGKAEGFSSDQIATLKREVERGYKEGYGVAISATRGLSVVCEAAMSHLPDTPRKTAAGGVADSLQKIATDAIASNDPTKLRNVADVLGDPAWSGAYTFASECLRNRALELEKPIVMATASTAARADSALFPMEES